MKGITRCMLSTREEHVTRDSLIAITHCPPAPWLETAKRISRMRLGTHAHRLPHDANTRLGIVKCMPKPGHEFFSRLLNYAIMMNFIWLDVVPTGPMGHNLHKRK